MTYKEIAALDKTSVPRGKEAEYAAFIKKYILHKSKLTRAFMIAFSAFVAACVLFIAIGRLPRGILVRYGGSCRRGGGMRCLRGGKYVCFPQVFKKV